MPNADIVFCLDASGTMAPTFDGVRQNILKIVQGLESDRQRSLDIRWGLLAFREDRNGVHRYEGAHLSGSQLNQAIYHGKHSDEVFTRDTKVITNALANIQPEGEEMQLVALDTALDFPWRESATCHRVIIMLTDEPIETGLYVDQQIAHLEELKHKIENKKVRLFLYAPKCKSFGKLAGAQMTIYNILKNEAQGCTEIDFGQILEGIGNSIRASQNMNNGETSPCPLYNQSAWTATDDFDPGSDIN